MADVTFARAEVLKLLPIYQLIRDCLDQGIKVKGDKYLPRPDSTDISPANVARYTDYLARAVFYDVTGRTLAGLVGQVYTNEPEVKLPLLISALDKDVNGSGIGLIQHSKETSEYAISRGRVGLFTDYPRTDRPATRQDLISGDIQPTISIYAPENIINWQWKKRGSKRILSLVVLQENYQHKLDTFSYEERIQYRVLSLDDESDIYTIEIFREQEVEQSITGRTPTKEFVPTPEFSSVPVDAKGNPLKEIPFTFVGATNNDFEPDSAPLFTLAELNIAHYRNSADYEESVYTVGQPTYVVTGLTDMWLKTQLKGVLKVGSRSGIPLPTGADAKILQVQPNTMAKEAMDQKESQMKAIGAKLIEDKQVAQTATEAGIVNRTEMSFLATIAKNVTEGYMSALRWCCIFAGETPTEDMFELNTEFAITRMSSQERTELVSEWVQGAITFTEMRRGLRDSGIAVLDDNEALAEIDAAQAKKDAQTVNQAKAMASAVPPPVGNISSGGA